MGHTRTPTRCFSLFIFSNTDHQPEMIFHEFLKDTVGPASGSNFGVVQLRCRFANCIRSLIRSLYVLSVFEVDMRSLHLKAALRACSQVLEAAAEREKRITKIKGKWFSEAISQNEPGPFTRRNWHYGITLVLDISLY